MNVNMVFESNPNKNLYLPTALYKTNYYTSHLKRTEKEAVVSNLATFEFNNVNKPTTNYVKMKKIQWKYHKNKLIDAVKRNTFENVTDWDKVSNELGLSINVLQPAYRKHCENWSDEKLQQLRDAVKEIFVNGEPKEDDILLWNKLKRKYFKSETLERIKGEYKKLFNPNKQNLALSQNVNCKNFIDRTLNDNDSFFSTNTSQTIHEKNISQDINEKEYKKLCEDIQALSIKVQQKEIYSNNSLKWSEEELKKIIHVFSMKDARAESEKLLLGSYTRLQDAYYTYKPWSLEDLNKLRVFVEKEKISDSENLGSDVKCMMFKRRLTSDIEAQYRKVICKIEWSPMGKPIKLQTK